MTTQPRGTQIGCGCCVGPEEDRCCCHIHQDITRGLWAHKCSMHEGPKRPWSCTPYVTDCNLENRRTKAQG